VSHDQYGSSSANSYGGWVPLALAALSQESGSLPAAVTASISRPAVPRNARP